MFPHNMFCVGNTSTDVKLARCESLVQFIQMLQLVIDKRDNNYDWTCIVRTKQLMCYIYTNTAVVTCVLSGHLSVVATVATNTNCNGFTL